MTTAAAWVLYFLLGVVLLYALVQFVTFAVLDAIRRYKSEPPKPKERYKRNGHEA